MNWKSFFLAMVVMAAVSAHAQYFQDTFASGSLDTTKWTAQTFVTPNYGGQGVTNTFTAANIDLSGGSLRMQLDQPTAGTANAVELDSVSSFGYGTYEWSIRASSTASSSGAAPGTAFSGSVSAGFVYFSGSITEIDAPEIQGQQPGTVYYTNWLNNVSSQVTTVPAFVPQDGFHLYKMVWEPGLVTFYIDGLRVAANNQKVPSHVAKVLINHWGTNSVVWGGTATVGTSRYMYCNSFKYWLPTSISSGGVL